MENLLAAIKVKRTGSTVEADVGGRFYLDEARQGAAFPYIVYFIVSGTPDKTFTENHTDTVMQFSIYSSATNVSEISNIHKDLKALFDECSLSISGSRLEWMRWTNLVTMREEVETPGSGSSDNMVSVRHWATEFEIRTVLI